MLFREDLNLSWNSPFASRDFFRSDLHSPHHAVWCRVPAAIDVYHFSMCILVCGSEGRYRSLGAVLQKNRTEVDPFHEDCAIRSSWIVSGGFLSHRICSGPQFRLRLGPSVSFKSENRPATQQKKRLKTSRITSQLDPSTTVPKTHSVGNPTITHLGANSRGSHIPNRTHGNDALLVHHLTVIPNTGKYGMVW